MRWPARHAWKFKSCFSTMHYSGMWVCLPIHTGALNWNLTETSRMKHDFIYSYAKHLTMITTVLFYSRRQLSAARCGVGFQPPPAQWNEDKQHGRGSGMLNAAGKQLRRDVYLEFPSCNEHNMKSCSQRNESRAMPQLCLSLASFRACRHSSISYTAPFRPTYKWSRSQPCRKYRVSCTNP